MNELFDKLGAAARRAAGSVSTELSIAAQEQKAQEAYMALGKLCYGAHKNQLAPSEETLQAYYARIDACLERIDQLRRKQSVQVENAAPVQTEVTAEESDFVTPDAE